MGWVVGWFRNRATQSISIYHNSLGVNTTVFPDICKGVNVQGTL